MELFRACSCSRQRRGLGSILDRLDSGHMPCGQCNSLILRSSLRGSKEEPRLRSSRRAARAGKAMKAYSAQRRKSASLEALKQRGKSSESRIDAIRHARCADTPSSHPDRCRHGAAYASRHTSWPTMRLARHLSKCCDTHAPSAKKAPSAFTIRPALVAAARALPPVEMQAPPKTVRRARC